jgi:hypothetical protein
MKARFNNHLVLALLVLAAAVLVPTVAHAQAQIVGQVRDESGGVLPGVTVEAASPAIIEKVRTAVTDDQGRYRIEALRPGLYKVTFSLTGTWLFRPISELIPGQTNRFWIFCAISQMPFVIRIRGTFWEPSSWRGTIKVLISLSMGSRDSRR